MPYRIFRADRQGALFQDVRLYARRKRLAAAFPRLALPRGRQSIRRVLVSLTKFRSKMTDALSGKLVGLYYAGSITDRIGAFINLTKDLQNRRASWK